MGVDGMGEQIVVALDAAVTRTSPLPGGGRIAGGCRLRDSAAINGGLVLVILSGVAS
jgi:hypothetical protein